MESTEKPIDLITAFDDMIAEVWGEEHRRPWPGQFDHGAAKEMFAAGARVDDVKLVLAGMFGRRHDQGERPPKSLTYCKSAVIESLQPRKTQEVARRNGILQIVSGDERQELEDAQWRAALKLHGKGIPWGELPLPRPSPPPGAPGCVVPERILMEASETTPGSPSPGR